MSVHLFPSKLAPTRLTPAEEAACRDRVLDAQCDLLDLVQRHRDLGVHGDVELLACLLGYLSTANGMSWAVSTSQAWTAPSTMPIAAKPEASGWPNGW